MTKREPLLSLNMSTQFDSGLFLRAMQLLHSPSKDANEQLKSMLDESLAQKKAPPVVPIAKPTGPTIKPVVANRQPAPVPNPILVPSDDIDPSGCVVCKRTEQRVGNEIVECQECHNLYHQECHKPSLENENVKDPRFVWYCSTCTSKRKKIKLPPPKQAPSSSGGTSTAKDPKEQQNPELSPFKSWSFLKK
jgi:integrator complex subunit 12